MNGLPIPAPRPAVDDELEAERAVAAAATRHDRREREAPHAARAAIAQLQNEDLHG